MQDSNTPTMEKSYTTQRFFLSLIATILFCSLAIFIGWNDLLWFFIFLSLAIFSLCGLSNFYVKDSYSSILVWLYERTEDEVRETTTKICTERGLVAFASVYQAGLININLQETALRIRRIFQSLRINLFFNFLFLIITCSLGYMFLIENQQHIITPIILLLIAVYKTVKTIQYYYAILDQVKSFLTFSDLTMASFKI